MKISPAFTALCILLGFSVLVNIVLLTRSRETPPARPAPAAARNPAFPDERSSRPAAFGSEPAASLPEASAPAPAVPASRTAAAPTRPGLPYDASIREVLDAQDKFNTFWKDLDRVFKAKDKLEEAKYFQAVVGATQDFLEFSEPKRTLFADAARLGTAELSRARKDRDDARKLLPPSDKSNPTVYAAYQQQKNAIDARYNARVKAAVEGVTALLDPGLPRHAEFSASADRWLKNLVPRATPP